MLKARAFTLNNGICMPAIGLGTWQMKSTPQENIVFKAVDAALNAGYRMIDTASVYRNETDIGNALRELLPKYGLKRTDVFITSKLAPAEQGTDEARQACLRSISKLGCDYLDLYLIHWPAASKLKHDDTRNQELRKQSWLSMEAMLKEGLVKSIGVSNYTVAHMKDLLSYVTVNPTVLQVEFHPLLYQKDLLDFCQQENVQLEAYSSLGVGQLVSEPQFLALASKYEKTTAQILLRWAIQQNVVVIPKSTNQEHIRSNMDIFDFELSGKDMTYLNSLSCDKHFCWNPQTVL